MNIHLLSLKKSLALTLFLIALTVPTVLAQVFQPKQNLLTKNAAPTITTEKGNYEVGEIVKINGTNFLGYERIRLNIKYLSNSLNQDILLYTTDIYADRRGFLTTNWELPDVNQEGTKFIVEATGAFSGKTSSTIFTTLAPSAIAVSISQCANSDATPQSLDCLGNGNEGWVKGNVNAAKARYFEGDSIAYRAVITGLTIGDQYKWTLGYDTSKGGIVAIDYLTSYNRTITNANPCQSDNGATPNAFCNPATAPNTFQIPTDPVVTAGYDQIPGNTDDVTQITQNQVVSAWGGTINAVSLPTHSNGTAFPAGDQDATVDITFTASSSTVVLAWGGHISTRDDWGQPTGSVRITGSPYHMRNVVLMDITNGGTCCGGQQDLQLSNVVVIATGKIIIIKNASPPTTTPFNFTTTFLTPSSFSLTDASSTTDPMQEFNGITDFATTKTVTELATPGYTLRAITCSVDITGSGTPTAIRNGSSAEINITSGSQITCTFFNDIVTAANVSVTGRVFDMNGHGLRRAYVSITDSSGNNRTTMTNQFGYYQLNEIEVGEVYFVNVRHKSYVFDTRLLNVNDNLNNINFSPSK